MRDDFDTLRVDCIGLSIRTVNALRRGGIETVAQLLQRSSIDLLRLPEIGRKALRDIEGVLSAFGLGLLDTPQEPAPDWAAAQSAARSVQAAVVALNRAILLALDVGVTVELDDAPTGLTFSARTFVELDGTRRPLTGAGSRT